MSGLGAAARRGAKGLVDLGSNCWIVICLLLVVEAVEVKAQCEVETAVIDD